MRDIHSLILDSACCSWPCTDAVASSVWSFCLVLGKLSCCLSIEPRSWLLVVMIGCVSSEAALLGGWQNAKKALRISNVQTPLSNTDVLLEGGGALQLHSASCSRGRNEFLKKKTRSPRLLVLRDTRIWRYAHNTHLKDKKRMYLVFPKT